MGAPKKKTRASTRALNQAFEEEASPQAIELFGRLKAWRLEVSRQAGVPPFAVFTDQTLRDIAQAPGAHCASGWAPDTKSITNCPPRWAAAT